MITKEDLKDLQPGDVVELHEDDFPDVVTRGPLREDGGTLWLARRPVRREDGRRSVAVEDATLTVVSRAPRPLYVNHPRTKPAAGDFVRSGYGDPDDTRTWQYDGNGGWWLALCGVGLSSRDALPKCLRLLVDGSTGQVVQ
jgi:hypothetical protein